MRYTVTWYSGPQAKLANIWLAERDRRSISAAADHIDRLLANDPILYGDEFYGDYLLVVRPLAVVYSISEQDRTVHVVDVWPEDDPQTESN